MFAKLKPLRRFHSYGLIILAGALALSTSLARADAVSIHFLPPPMEGTLSLGIYDAGGSLVRVLQREADPEDFTQADDALITQWDGKDDQGNFLPAGTYRAKGVRVGDLGVSGEEYLGNDWVTEEDSPHVNRITNVAFDQTGLPVLSATVPGETAVQYFTLELKPAATPGEEPEIKLSPTPPLPGKNPFPVTEDIAWKIEKNGIRGIRGLAIATIPFQPGEPPAVSLAFRDASKLYVLYQNDKMQRLRGYDFTGVKLGDAPKVMFQSDITFSDSREQAAPLLKFPDGKPFVASPALNATLVRNPLFKNKPGSLTLQALVNKDGAWLAASDGLPLCKVSDTPHLRWAALGSPAPKKPISFFTSDGAVVERYQISAAAEMMAFDAGTYAWIPPAPSPSPSPSATVQP